MIIHLKGTVLDRSERFLVLEVNNIGYKVFGTTETIESGTVGQTRSLWIHHVVREDVEDLFGFDTKDELEFFELLIGISGIGPRTALGILNVTTISALKKAVSSGDTSHLTKVSGIGKKNADKIVLELKGKFEHDDSIGHGSGDVDVVEALQSLGYSQNDARKALKEIDGGTTQEKIKQALKILNK
ncbi:MAG: Holliday junction helicase RuvA, holliday junction helicase RuvA [Candidatus Taylorbacteria bacterium]|nr:Holliday junction helicase RuvA, holliday junction helicase RuvA [Candidatus Taylorbacteria bacterium]